MEKNARAYVFEGMEMLPEILSPFVKARLDKALPRDWQRREVELKLNLRRRDGKVEWDLAKLLRAMDICWREAFASVLGPAERSMVFEVIDVRNRHAHNSPFSLDDAERALDTMHRLTTAIGATAEAGRLREMRDDIARQRLGGAPPERGKADNALPRGPRIMRNETAWKSPAHSPPERSGAEETPSQLPPPPVNAGRSFRRAEFEAELLNMLAEARAEGRARCRVVSRELHRRVVGGPQPHRMPMACNAMWKLWREQGGVEAHIIRTTPSGRSSTIEIDYTV